MSKKNGKSKKSLPKASRGNKVMNGIFPKVLQAPMQEELDALVILYSGADTAAVIKSCKEMIEAYPNHWFAWKVLGAGLKKSGEIEKALQAMRKATTLNRADIEAWLNMGVKTKGHPLCLT